MSEITQTGGYLDVVDATLRAPRLEATSNIGIANTAPQHAFSVGSNLYVDTESSNVLTVRGNVVTQGVKVGTIEIVPSYDLAAVSNVGNVTQSTIQFSNATTGFVTTANIEVGTANLFVDTTTGRVGIGKTDPGAALEVTGNAYVSSNLEVGTANLFVDTVNSRVGIGTNAPNTLLELSSATGSATITPTELRLSSSTDAGDWDTTTPYARLAFYTGDVTADAPGVMASIGAVASSADGGENTRLSFFTAEPHVERMCVDRYGNVGIGTTNPGNSLHIYKNANERTSGLFIEKAQGGTNAAALFFGVNDTGENPGVAKAAIFYERNMVNGRGDIKFCNNAVNDATAVTPAVADTRMIIKNNGNVGIGITDPPENLTVQDSIISPSFGLRRKSYNDYVVYMKNTTGAFTTVTTSNDAVLLVGKGSGSNRSINAKGTINVNGSDYAEYMKKSRTDLVIKKGDIVGINNDGELTNVFSESIQFVVKSTDPSYVGGDSWNQGTVNTPKYPSVMLRVDEYSNISSQDANLYTYWEEQNLYANTEQLNVYYEENEKYLEDRNLHRDPYDRIAFCGQVPVNVYNATPGQYVIPKQTDDDTISYELTNTPTFEQYQISIGKVIKIQEDGRAFIIVKIS
jgi:hypothetical protein